MTEWTPEATARYHDELQRLRAETPTADDYEAQLALCRNLYDELFSQTEQLRDALRFYADPASYRNATPRYVRAVIADEGKRAREALGEKP